MDFVFKMLKHFDARQALFRNLHDTMESNNNFPSILRQNAAEKSNISLKMMIMKMVTVIMLFGRMTASHADKISGLIFFVCEEN